MEHYGGGQTLVGKFGEDDLLVIMQLLRVARNNVVSVQNK